MKKLYHKHIIAVCILCLIVIGSIFEFSSFARSVEKKVLATKESSAKVALYERNRAQFDQESVLLNGLKDRVGQLKTYVVTPDTVPNTLSELEAIAIEHHVTFEIQNVQTPLDSTKQKKLLITFLAAGSLTEVQSFFDALRAQPFLVHITNFSLEQNANTTAPTDIPLWQSIATVQIISFNP